MRGFWALSANHFDDYRAVNVALSSVRVIPRELAGKYKLSAISSSYCNAQAHGNRTHVVPKSNIY